MVLAVVVGAQTITAKEKVFFITILCAQNQKDCNERFSGNEKTSS